MDGLLWLEVEGKKTFSQIDSNFGSQATTDAFLRSRALPLQAPIDEDIVDITIVDMMFHSGDMNGTYRACHLSSFEPSLDP